MEFKGEDLLVVPFPSNKSAVFGSGKKVHPYSLSRRVRHCEHLPAVSDETPRGTIDRSGVSFSTNRTGVLEVLGPVIRRQTDLPPEPPVIAVGFVSFLLKNLNPAPVEQEEGLSFVHFPKHVLFTFTRGTLSRNDSLKVKSPTVVS